MQEAPSTPPAQLVFLLQPLCRTQAQGLDSQRWRWRTLGAAVMLVLCALPLAGCLTFPHKTAAAAKPANTPAVTKGKPASKLVGTARVGPGSSMGATEITAGMPAPTVRKATRETRVGEVRVIGAGRRFVLIEVSARPGLPVLSPGLELHVRTPAGSGTLGGEETATLRVSSERRQPFIVADVLSGEPHVDDLVYFSAENLSGVIPSMLLRPQPEPEPTPPTMTPPPDSTPTYRATATVHPE